LGAVLGVAGSNAVFNANSAENKALVDQAVAAVVAAQADTAADSGEPDPNRRYDVSADDDPFLGSPDAQVTIIEFSDFNCGYCGRYATETLNPLIEAYGDRVKFVYRDYPFLAQSSLDAAMAAQCAFEQSQAAFWSYHNSLFRSQGQFQRSFYISLAEQGGLDIDQFTTCLDTSKYRDEIVNDAMTAQQLGVRGTPAFFINGRFVSGAQPYTVFARMIEEELAALESGDSAS
jgi:protein-disulfide isomerase